jgi:DNA-binding MarR family transcriptional regulator
VFRRQYLDVKNLCTVSATYWRHASFDVKSLDAYAGEVSDDVDRLVEGWSRERPDVDVSPLQVLSRVTRLAQQLDRARRASFAAHQLDIWEFDVLSALRRAGSPYELSPGALVRETLVTSGTMTNRVDRLVARQLVTRRADPDDRRAVLVGLTAVGRETVDAALDALLASERDLLAGLDGRDQQRLAALLRELTAAFHRG